MRKLQTDCSGTKKEKKVLFLNMNPYVEEYMSSYGLEIIKSYIENYSPGKYNITIINPFHEYDTDTENTIRLILQDIPELIGISIRNIDNGYTIEDSNSQVQVQTKYYLDKICFLIKKIKGEVPDIPIIAGGASFTFYPERMMNYLGLEYGIIGPGEFTINEILKEMDLGSLNKERLKSLPGIVLRDEAGIYINRNIYSLKDEVKYTVSKDSCFDVAYSFPKRQFQGTQAYLFPVRTHTGCGQKCSYCVESLNHNVSYRSIENIINEIEYLVEHYNCRKIHFTSSEMNLPNPEFVIKLCRKIVEHGLNKKLKWTSYFSIAPFTMEMAVAIKEAGCEVVCFSVDNFDDNILKSLNKSYKYEDIVRTLDICEKAGLPTESGIMFGAPKDTKEIIDYNILKMQFYINKNCGHTFKYICGLRVYPDTLLYDYVKQHGNVNTYSNYDIQDAMDPVLYCEGYKPTELLLYLQDAFKDYDSGEHGMTQNEKKERRLVGKLMFHLSKKQVDEAAYCLKQLIEIDKNNAKYNYFLAEYYINTGNIGKGKECIDKVLKCFENNKFMKPIDQAIIYQSSRLQKLNKV